MILAAGAVASIATLLDTVAAKNDFLQGLGKLKIEMDASEKLYVKKRKRDFNYLIAIKFFFVIIFVVLALNMM